MSDDAVKAIHNLEQATGHTRRVAVLVASYYAALREQGMAEQPAIILAMSHQRDLLSGAYARKPEAEPPDAG